MVTNGGGFFIYDDTDSRQPFTINTHGNVLIGTTNTNSVGSQERNLILGNDVNNSEVAYVLNVMEGSNNRRVKFFLDDDTGDYGLDATASSGVPRFVIRNATTETFTVNQSGNVGIGTNSPAVNLHVQSSAPKLRLTDSDTNADSDISASSSNGSLFLSADTNNEAANSVLAFQVDGATKAYIGTDGLYTQSGANSSKILDNSTRNLTNIGTISSGAITTSGNLTFSPSGDYYAGLGSTNALHFENSSGQTLMSTASVDIRIDANNSDTNRFFSVSHNSSSNATSGGTDLFKITEDGTATFSGDVFISEPNPTLILKDTSDDDDHGIRFRDNGGTDRYSITTLNDNFNFITEGSRELIFKPAGTEKFRVGAAYNESKQDLRFPDNAILRLGTGTDLNIYHNGTDSLINNDTGHLYIQNYTDDGDIRFYSDNGSGGTAEYIRCDGGLGQVKLFHYGSEKFITTSAGVKVTGEVNLTGELEINGTDVITSSRNLVNIGTISSTDFTTNGAAVVVQNKNLTILNQPVNISSPNNSRIKFLQTTSGASATKGSIQWFDSNSNSCGTIRVVGDGVEDNSGKMEFFVTAQTDELGDDPFGINKMMTITENGVQVHGSLSKSSGSFRIDHPLKPETHDLVHSFVEGPQADNLYRGVIKLENGRATVDLDEWFDMTAGTFLALNRDIQAFVNNSETWDAVRAKVMGSQLVIECQNPESNAEVSWLVIGERQDKEIHESALTNDNGKIIVEPEKVG